MQSSVPMSNKGMGARLAGERVKALIEERQLTREQIADKLGFDKSQLSRWFSDKGEQATEISTGNLLGLAKLLGASPEYLVGQEGNSRERLAGHVRCELSDEEADLLLALGRVQKNARLVTIGKTLAWLGDVSPQKKEHHPHSTFRRDVDVDALESPEQHASPKKSGKPK